MLKLKLCNLAFRFDKEVYDTKTFNVYKTYILPMIREKQGINSIDIMLGISKMHSNNLHTLKEIARNNNIDFFEFLRNNISNQEFNETKVNNLALSIKKIIGE